MEGFDLISTGVWSIIPPILALGLALITKEVYSSLAIGVFVGMVIYQFSLNGVGVEPLVDSFTMVPQMMAEQIAGNGALLLFLALLGALVVVIAAAGGSRAYAEWVSTHIKNAKMAQILTAVLGIIIFVDDYFNCLTVGAVMRPVTDRFNISHEKLAWIIDSTAAPICIIAPVSSWAVAVGGYLGEGGFTTFVQSIPYNFYALLTIVFVFFMCATKKDFGPMRVAEAEVQKPADQQHRIPSKDSALESMSTVGISDPNAADALPAKLDTIVAEEDELDEAAKVAVEEFKGMAISDKGRVFDLIIPIIVLIIFSILGMLYAGGFFQGVDFATAVARTGVRPVHRRVRGAGGDGGHVPAAQADDAVGIHGRRGRGRALHGGRHHDPRAGMEPRRHVPLPAGYGRVRQRLPEQHRRGAGSAAGGHLRGGGVHRLRMGTSWEPSC